MQNVGGEGAKGLARRRYSVERPPPAPAADRPVESHLSHLSHLIPANPALNFLLIHENPLTDALFLLVSKSDEVTTT